MKPPEEVKRDLVRQWLTKAENDLGVARHLAAESGYFTAVAFHAQQAAEKYLKAFLVEHQVGQFIAEVLPVGGRGEVAADDSPFSDGVHHPAHRLRRQLGRVLACKHDGSRFTPRHRGNLAPSAEAGKRRIEVVGLVERDGLVLVAEQDVDVVFDERVPVDPPVLFEELPSLRDEILISQIEGAVEVPEVHVSQVFEKTNRVTHCNPCRSNCAVNRTIVGGTLW